MNLLAIWTLETLPDDYNYTLHSVVHVPSCVLYLRAIESYIQHIYDISIAIQRTPLYAETFVEGRNFVETA